MFVLTSSQVSNIEYNFIINPIHGIIVVQNPPAVDVVGKYIQDHQAATVDETLNKVARLPFASDLLTAELIHETTKTGWEKYF